MATKTTKTKTTTGGVVRDRLIGRHVVVRSSPSGVWLGILEAREGTTVHLREARRA